MLAWESAEYSRSYIGVYGYLVAIKEVVGLMRKQECILYQVDAGGLTLWEGNDVGFR